MESLDVYIRRWPSWLKCVSHRTVVRQCRHSTENSFGTALYSSSATETQCKNQLMFLIFYATETYIMHFLEPAWFLNTLDLAGSKVNVLYNPGLAEKPPLQLFTYLWVFGPWNNHSVLICIKLPMNLFFFYMALAPYDLLRGKDITWAMKVSTFMA